MPVARRAIQRLLGLSLFAKVLVANSLVVALGAVAGTYLTAEHVRGSPAPARAPYEAMVAFGGAGLALSVALNAAVLRAAFSPLAQLERAARRVAGGELAARARLGALRDPETATLAASFNLMLDTIQADARRLAAYSARLHELSDQVLLAQEDERRRLARELHDQTGQELSTLLLGLKLFRDAAARPQPDLPALRARAAELAELARRTLDGVRTLALELRPRVLDDLGLATALRAYAEEWSARTRVPVAFADLTADPDDLDNPDDPDDPNDPADPDDPDDLGEPEGSGGTGEAGQTGGTGQTGGAKLPASIEIAVYRLVQEALVNVAKHAGASRVSVTLARRDGALVVEVRDDGRGMPLVQPPHPLPAAGSDGRTDGRPDGRTDERLDERPDGRLDGGGLSAGLGLFGAQERVALVGGRFALESAPGQGTTVRAVIPLGTRSE